jgi:hypothetical protein
MRPHLLSFIAATTLATAAYASAWTQDQGNGQAILSASYYGADQYWDNGGNKQSQPSYSKYELNPYLEYGLSDGLTIGTNFYLQHLYQDTGSGSHSSWGLGDSEFFLRKRLINQDGYALAIEPLIKLPSPEPGSETPRIGSATPDAALGLSGGKTFSAYGFTHFVDIDTMYRHRFGAPNDQINISGTLGINVAPRWTIMPQTFLTFRTDSRPTAAFTESPSDDYNLVRLQLSGLYKLSDQTSLQLGAFYDVDGKNVGLGRGVLLALWRNF